MKFSVASAFAAAMMAADAVTAAPLEPRAPNVAYFSGFNLGANKANGDCKSTQDWIDEFNTIRSWNPEFTTVKLFSTSDCSALANAAPAATQTGFKIWVGLWPGPEAAGQGKFGQEKGALEAAIEADGTGWLAGINVGSESLYRNETSPDTLAVQIWDVKGMVQSHFNAPDVVVGTADTWTSWVNASNAIVIQASDVIIMNAFPYWQGAQIDAARGVFQEAVANTKAAVGEKQLVIGETGWPTGGPDFGDAHPSVENLQKFYKSTGCDLRGSKIPHFWFSGFDEPNKTSDIEKNFGIATSDRNIKIDITC